MATQLEKMLKYAVSQLGSSYWHGYCQAFVAACYEHGTGKFISCSSAKESRKRYMKAETGRDLFPPAGAAVYFYGDGEMGRKYGHVALSVGNGWIYDPVSKVVQRKLNAEMHNGYLGWGWLGGLKPEGAAEIFGDPQQETVQASNKITRVQIVSEIGSKGNRAADLLSPEYEARAVSILIQNGNRVYSPVLVGEVRLSSSYSISAAVLKFSVLEDEVLQMENGCPVAFRYCGKPMFYGYIFEMHREIGGQVAVICYDQLRYLKNKDSFLYNLTYSGLLRYIANKYKLKMGSIAETGYMIPPVVAEDSLLDILAEARAQTRLHTGEDYVLYDDFGRLMLRPLRDMRIDIYLDAECFASAYIEKSIQKGVYNRVVLAADDRSAGTRSLYIANDTQKQSQWGVLQLYEKVGEDYPAEMMREMAQKRLQQCNAEYCSLVLRRCTGNPDVRGGTVILAQPEVQASAVYMVCEHVEHVFFGNEYYMNLELSGGNA